VYVDPHLAAIDTLGAVLVVALRIVADKGVRLDPAAYDILERRPWSAEPPRQSRSRRTSFARVTGPVIVEYAGCPGSNSEPKLVEKFVTSSTKNFQ